MRINVSSYIPGDTVVHTCDARVKIVLLLVYSVTLFLVHSWVGMGFCTLGFIGAVAASKIPLRRFLALLIPVYVIAAFTIVFNGFSFNVYQVTDMSAGLGDVSSGILANMSPVALIGSFGLVPAGFARGCFYAVRIVLLVVASLVVTYTTTSTQLTSALASFLRPLRTLKVPVDDIAMVFSLALRFIPVTAEEFGRIYDAQWTRGAPFSEGSLWGRLHAWQTVLIPLFVGLFRRADTLATAMDARCYGAAEGSRTSLAKAHVTAQSVAVLVVGVALCGALAIWL